MNLPHDGCNHLPVCNEYIEKQIPEEMTSAERFHWYKARGFSSEELVAYTVVFFYFLSILNMKVQHCAIKYVMEMT